MVRPCFPITFPISVWATRTSIRVVPSRSISRTSTASTSSTRALTIISTVSRIIQSDVRCLLDCFRFSGRLSFRGLLDYLAHGISRLSNLLDPVANAFVLEGNLCRFARWIVRPEVFQKRAIALGLLFLDHDTVRGS